MLRRPEVFDDDHLPRQLLHRERETKQLLRALDPGPDGDGRGHAVISGPSGVGKTVLLRYCSRTLERERSIDSAYVRCLGSTSGTVLRETIGDLAGGPDEIAHNQPLEAVVDALHTAVDGTTIVVLDEADDVPGTAVETLTDIRGVSVCLICHEPDRWYSNADPEVRDRLRAGTELHLDRYGVDELADILDRRAQAGLAPGAVGRDHLEQIADDVAGVARDGIQTLRYAATAATEAGRDRIRATDLEAGRARAEQAIRAANLRSLPFRYQFLYAVIRNAGEISSGAIYEHYDAVGDRVWRGRSGTPPSRRTIRDHLRKLREYDLIESADSVHRAIDPSLEPTHDGIDIAVDAPQ